ncbi:MAG: FAD-binding protein [Candidatus Methylomirabilaceae bacterium]
MTLVRIPPPREQDVDLSKTYDAVIVGSGAAGGMAAHVMTAQGMQVLMLEAGKKLPIEQELRSMEWPYDHPRRGDAAPGSHGLSFNEYTIRKPPGVFFGLALVANAALAPHIGLGPALLMAVAFYLPCVPVLFRYARVIWAHVNIGTIPPAEWQRERDRR